MGDPLKAEQEMQECLTDLESAAEMRYGDGVRTAIADMARPKFIDQEPKWKDFGHEVKRSSRFVGRYARLFAEFDGVPDLRTTDVLQAIAIVKPMCHAGTAAKTGRSLFYYWCP